MKKYVFPYGPVRQPYAIVDLIASVRNYELGLWNVE
jgi:hypothetical protein